MTHELGWLLFFVALIVSVCIHEAGHFLTAKRFGMKATQFFAGFGPALDTDLSGHNKETTIAARLTIGGWFGPWH